MTLVLIVGGYALAFAWHLHTLGVDPTRGGSLLFTERHTFTETIIGKLSGDTALFIAPMQIDQISSNRQGIHLVESALMPVLIRFPVRGHKAGKRFQIIFICPAGMKRISFL